MPCFWEQGRQDYSRHRIREEYSWKIKQYPREEMRMPRSRVRISRGDPGGAHGRGMRKRLWELMDCQNVKTCKDSRHEEKERERRVLFLIFNNAKTTIIPGRRVSVV